MHPLAPFPFPLEAFREGGRTMAGLSVGYQREDAFNMAEQSGVAVITTSREQPVQQASKAAANYTIVDIVQDNKHSPSASNEKSDEEDSDHGMDPYAQHMKGRVSPSPYTANTERAREFNAHVRNVIEEKLDTLVPISHQPRELIQQIIADIAIKYPEFATSIRKRIRTYLKSYRRSKRVKDMQAAAALAHQYQPVTNGLTKDQPLDALPTTLSTPLPVPPMVSLPTETPEIGTKRSVSSMVAISNAMSSQVPEPKKPKITPPTLTPSVINHSTPQQQLQNNSTVLSVSEVSALRQLIQGYRESAAFLNRAADQLEQMLVKESNP